MIRYKLGDIVLLDKPQRIVRIDMIRTFSGGIYVEYEGLNVFANYPDESHKKWDRVMFKQEAIVRKATETDLAIARIKCL